MEYSDARWCVLAATWGTINSARLAGSSRWNCLRFAWQIEKKYGSTSLIAAISFGSCIFSLRATARFYHIRLSVLEHFIVLVVPTKRRLKWACAPVQRQSDRQRISSHYIGCAITLPCLDRFSIGKVLLCSYCYWRIPRSHCKWLVEWSEWLRCASCRRRRRSDRYRHHFNFKLHFTDHSNDNLLIYRCCSPPTFNIALNSGSRMSYCGTYLSSAAQQRHRIYARFRHCNRPLLWRRMRTRGRREPAKRQRRGEELAHS